MHVLTAVCYREVMEHPRETSNPEHHLVTNYMGSKQGMVSHHSSNSSKVTDLLDQQGSMVSLDSMASPSNMEFQVSTALRVNLQEDNTGHLLDRYLQGRHHLGNIGLQLDRHRLDRHRLDRHRLDRHRLDRHRLDNMERQQGSMVLPQVRRTDSLQHTASSSSNSLEGISSQVWVDLVDNKLRHLVSVRSSGDGSR